MAKGRKRKPTSLKVIQGTFRKDRETPGSPQPEAGLPNAPDKLEPRAIEWFGRLAQRLSSQQLASPSHAEMLSLAARRLAEIEHYEELIAKYGHVYETTNKNGDFSLRANPAVNLKSEAMRHLHALLAEFGQSPASIGKVSIIDNPSNSAWESFRA